MHTQNIKLAHVRQTLQNPLYQPQSRFRFHTSHTSQFSTLTPRSSQSSPTPPSSSHEITMLFPHLTPHYFRSSHLAPPHRSCCRFRRRRSRNSLMQVEITKSPKIGTSFATLIGNQQSVKHL